MRVYVEPSISEDFVFQLAAVEYIEELHKFYNTVEVTNKMISSYFFPNVLVLCLMYYWDLLLL